MSLKVNIIIILFFLTFTTFVYCWKTIDSGEIYEYILAQPPTGTQELNVYNLIKLAKQQINRLDDCMKGLVPSPDGKMAAIRMSRFSGAYIAFMWKNNNNSFTLWPHPYQMHEQVFGLEWSPSGRYLAGWIMIEQGGGKIENLLVVEDFNTKKQYFAEMIGLLTFYSDNELFVLKELDRGKGIYRLKKITLKDSGLSAPEFVKDIQLPSPKEQLRKIFFSGEKLYVYASFDTYSETDINRLYSIDLESGKFNEQGTFPLHCYEVIPSPDRNKILIPDFSEDESYIVSLEQENININKIPIPVVSWWLNGEHLLMVTSKQSSYLIPKGEKFPEGEDIGYIVDINGKALSQPVTIPDIFK